jgi:uncharacterized protein YgbK (DUF1537 family)
VICPAFPDLHRSVVGGTVLVDGVPVGQTAAATDPVTPRTTSDVTEIVPGAVRGSLPQNGRVPRLVLDAATDTDLDGIAEHLAHAGPDVVGVGSGGLAAALGRCWSHSRDRATATEAGSVGRILVAVSSLHPVTAGQLQYLRTSPAEAGVDVLTTNSETTTTPAEAAADLADRVAETIAGQAYGALVLVGGDGAAAVLARLGADRVAIDGAVHAGCPTGIVYGGHADGLRLVTKSGGFGDPTTLASITTRLRAEPGPDPRPDRELAVGQPPQKETS